MGVRFARDSGRRSNNIHADTNNKEKLCSKFTQEERFSSKEERFGSLDTGMERNTSQDIGAELTEAVSEVSEIIDTRENGANLCYYQVISLRKSILIRNLSVN